jgi:NarL family two-component system response regulator LiaR
MKILLADDHHLFLEGMRSVLNSLFSDVEFECVSNGHQALEKLSTGAYDVALVDLRLPGVDGFSLLAELSKSLCLTPIIMVTASEDPWDVEKTLQLGAMGFVSKSANGNQIQNAIESVLRGEIVQPNHYAQLSEGSPTSNDWASQHNITPRQLEVLRLIRHGLSNQAIAEQLFLSLATVKTHIVAIFQALGTQSRTEAIQKAQRLGLD